jgi:hypothetical protein
MKPTLVHEGDKPLDSEPDDMRAAFVRAMAMLFIMNGRLCETELQLRQLRGESVAADASAMSHQPFLLVSTYPFPRTWFQ